MSGAVRSAFLALVLLAWPGLAQAAVRISFWSHEFDGAFPHAFVVMKGTLDSTGEAIDTDLGFSAVRLTPALFVRSVEGIVQVDRVTPPYMRKSNEHFSLTLTDEEYRAVLAVADRWRARPQPNYHINQMNCVIFVAEIAQALKLNAAAPAALVKKPRAFLDKVLADSAALILARNSAPAAPALAAAPPPTSGSAEPQRNATIGVGVEAPAL